LGAGRSLTFLAHGFNVTREVGRTNLDGFARAAAALEPQLDQRCVGVLWPGDDFLSPLTYSLEESDADRTARELARTITRRMSGVSRPNFVAHSLGCRVVLETMVLLLREGIACGEVVLMAAAVDSDALARSRRYAAAVRAATRVSILSSTADLVLQIAFPAGDFLASLLHGGYTRAALGRVGSHAARNPFEPVPPNVRDRPIGRFGVGHGDYLPSQNPNSKQRGAARFTARCLEAELAPDYNPVT
jgi:hypothetical protein